MNLHKHLPDVRFFILLSSLTGVEGHMSQANYAAGNTFQDALARHRSANGLPAVAIDLGGVESVGFVAEAGEGVRKRVEEKLGAVGMPIERVLGLISAAITDPRRKIDDSQVITCIANYDSIPEGNAVKNDKRFATLRLDNPLGGTGSAKTGGTRNVDQELTQSLKTSAPMSPEAVELVTDALVTKVANLFNTVPAEIDAGLALSHYGVDSLVAVELRNWLNGVVKAKVSVFEILQNAAMRDFARLVVGRSALIA